MVHVDHKRIDDAGSGDLFKKIYWNRGSCGSQVQVVTTGGLLRRAHHTATLLTEGRLLLASGVSPEGPLPPLQAPPGVTAVSGRVLLATNGSPLAGVTLELVCQGEERETHAG